MFRSIKEAKAFLADRDDRHKYERSQFDAFLEYHQFSFKVPAIHVSGTNGKGTTCKMLANIYAVQGYRVGMFSSPFLFYENEMWQINGQSISDADLLTLINRYAVSFMQFGITAFEMEAFLAFIYFAEQKVDLAIIEVGMGGRLDATNVFTPMLSIITNVTLEHTQFLGRTLKEIALAKAGIIKSDIPVLVGQDILAEPLSIIKSVAEKQQSAFFQADAPCNIQLDYNFISFDFDESLAALKIKKPAYYYALDAMIAITGLKILEEKFPVSDESIRTGLLLDALPARMEIVHESPRIIIDGAHNPGAMKVLVENLQLLKIKSPIIIFSAYHDKDVEQEFAMLKEVDARITLTFFDHSRSRRQEEYPPNNYPFIISPITAIKKVMATARIHDTIIITGSLGFAGYISFLWKEGVFND
ncbi:MAG TPA: cyanophycin synthetase [Bacilli bacterium]|nr:cyanophycin synthetase [Bacilli bacterium]